MTVKGIFYALGACLVWGLIFVVPQFMSSFNAIEIAVGRYLVYGIASLLFFIKIKQRYPFVVWKKAFLYSFIFCVGYYPCLIMGLRYASPAISALLMGMGPITIALYGNLKQKECSFKSLIFPSIFIFLGLVFVNAPALQNADTPLNYFLGLFGCLCALITWTWYVVANVQFLKSRPEITPNIWATLNGVATLAMVLLFIGSSSYGISFEKYSDKSFLLGCIVLGVICSWFGIFLWNKATACLPVSLAGQLTIFETIFGILYFYTLEQGLPPLMELIGIVLFLVAITYGIRKSSQTTISP